VVPERLKALADLRWVTFEDVLEKVGFPVVPDLLVAQDHAFGHRVQTELRRLLAGEPQGHQHLGTPHAPESMKGAQG
jgi:hypothetical protein